ncbi:hypothetical protein U1Q18_051131 [Sarracenia purpurea var. burkii]
MRTRKAARRFIRGKPGGGRIVDGTVAFGNGSSYVGVMVSICVSNGAISSTSIAPSAISRSMCSFRGASGFSSKSTPIVRVLEVDIVATVCFLAGFFLFVGAEVADDCDGCGACVSTAFDVFATDVATEKDDSIFGCIMRSTFCRFWLCGRSDTVGSCASSSFSASSVSGSTPSG